jgi:hypothetical protein
VTGRPLPTVTLFWGDLANGAMNLVPFDGLASHVTGHPTPYLVWGTLCMNGATLWVSFSGLVSIVKGRPLPDQVLRGPGVNGRLVSLSGL